MVDCMGGFVGFLWQRGSEKEIGKKLNNVWLRCKKNKRIDAKWVMK